LAKCVLARRSGPHNGCRCAVSACRTRARHGDPQLGSSRLDCFRRQSPDHHRPLGEYQIA
jgi:hypothetical protein